MPPSTQCAPRARADDADAGREPFRLVRAFASGTPLSDGAVLEDLVVKLKLDLHDIYNRGDEIDRALRAIIDEAIRKRAPLVQIIPGKGSGQLKKRVLRFLDRKDIKTLYHRVEKDSDNFGRVFVHFRWK
jgi:DNA-nicking Smr family endonuclease